MIFSIDCDGTATRYPELFVALGRALREAGHTVFVLTGIPFSVFESQRKVKYPHFQDHSWYDSVLTSDDYNRDERELAKSVVSGDLDNHILVGIFKRRICKELGICLHFDDDVDNVRADNEVPVFGVARQGRR